jgi:hypothetical protein
VRRPEGRRGGTLSERTTASGERSAAYVGPVLSGGALRVLLSLGSAMGPTVNLPMIVVPFLA